MEYTLPVSESLNSKDNYRASYVAFQMAEVAMPKNLFADRRAGVNDSFVMRSPISQEGSVLNDGILTICDGPHSSCLSYRQR